MWASNSHPMELCQIALLKMIVVCCIDKFVLSVHFILY